jgi:hypothetical protein
MIISAVGLRASELNSNSVPYKEACEVRRLMASLGVIHGEVSMSADALDKYVAMFSNPIP